VGCGTETTPPSIAGITENSTIEVKVGAAEIDLSGISAEDASGNAVDVRVTGAYDLNVVGDYNIVISAKDSNGFTVSINAVLSVVAETCEENPEQEICKTDVDRARELYEGTIYNVDEDNNGTADWMEVNLELEMGFSYYGDVDEDNAVWMNVLKFMEKYPNITVTRNPLYSSGWEGGDDGLLLIQEAALLEGTLPDIFFNPKGAETYDKGMTLDLTPYVDTDEEAQFITPNALSGMRTYDNEEMWGIPWQGVGPMVAVNVGLLDDLGITRPGYDWTYAEYEALRSEIGVITDAGQCVFPGIIDWEFGGVNYFDGIPNGYRGYNTVTQRFDFVNATGFGSWLEQIAAEAKRGWHYWDLEETDRELLCPDVTNSWTDGVRGINTIYLWEFNSAVNTMVNKDFEIDIYPYPIAPEGGETSTYIYHDYYSLSKLLEDDRVTAEAAFQLVKWLTFGEEGLESRWSLIDDLNVLVPDANDETKMVSPFINGDRYLMDFIQGWPITSNPNVLEMHPLVKGFGADSGGLDRYNFDAFQNADFQYQLSNGHPYPRHIPAFASVANDFYFYDLKNQMRDEGLSWIDIAPSVQEDLNEQIVEYLQYYIGVNTEDEE
jgi:multiple sugar transport system substrate-binding protein